MNETEKTYIAYREKCGEPPLPQADYPVSKYGFFPPEWDDDLTPLLAKCIAENRPATEEECTRAAYFRDGWYWGRLSGIRDGKRIHLRARTFAELKDLGNNAFSKGGVFDGAQLDPD